VLGVRFLVVGEALVDVVRRRDGTVVTRPGGSPANVAVGLGRLGHQVQLITALGDDARGRLVTDHLEASHVGVLPAPLERTSVAQAVLDETGQATYEFDIVWEIGELAIATAPEWLHVGSIGATLRPGADVVADLVDTCAGRSRISYDPNCRPLLMVDPLPQMERIAARADVLKLSDEDAAWLFPGVPVEDVLRRWADLGPALVVMTLGGDGALALFGDELIDVPVPEGGPVVDTVGAGDAFMTGLLSGLVGRDLDRDTVQGALTTAAITARRTCERVGADPPWAS
jgi:fructokinase